MNNEICNRCRLKYSLIRCENCKETFCTECDSYIHSIISKKDHIRKMLYTESTNETITKLNLNYEPKQSQSNLEYSEYSLYKTNNKKRNSNIDFPSTRYSDIPLTLYEEFKNEDNSQRINYRQTFNSFGDVNENFDILEKTENNEINEDNKLNRNVSGFYINEIKNIYSNEKNELIEKINELSKELVDTKTNLGEHIEYLNNQIIDIENKHKEEISELILKYSDDLKLSKIEKDTKIKELESELSVEKEKNEKMKIKLEEYEKTIINNKNNIEKLSEEKNILIMQEKKMKKD